MIQKLAKVRPYYKFEIAQLYRISRPVFMEWIKEIEEVLEETGYVKTQQIFTLKQTEIIFNWLGHPPATNDKEIHNGKRVLIIPYSKSELAEMYNLSSKTLLAQIESIPDKEAKKIIMDGNHKYMYIRKTDKKLFKTKEAELIFKYLGHPYK
ncbi:MAG: DUF4248 domain-containing protein [Bacteroidales bacterium]|nr:DUF4248 domain-containing protein [Bacteroidales bacterium]